MYIFDQQDHMIKKFGSNGSNHSEFRGPSGVCFDNNNFCMLPNRKVTEYRNLIWTVILF